MKNIKLIFIFLALFFLSPYYNAAVSSLVCFEEIGNAEFPFEIYQDGAYGAIFLQPGHGGSGLSADAFPVVERASFNLQEKTSRY